LIIPLCANFASIIVPSSRRRDPARTIERAIDLPEIENADLRSAASLFLPVSHNLPVSAKNSMETETQRRITP
jgi:hypothetical protein